jgi:hypothetical protein
MATSRIPGATLLSILGIVDNVLVYTGRIPNKLMKIGDPVAIETKPNGKSYYRIAGALYSPVTLITGLRTQDAQWIDNANNANAKAHKLKPRDLEIYEKLKAGGVYADIGADYGLSRQRIKQIVDKLAAYGMPVSAKAERMEARAEAYAVAKVSKFGADHAAIEASPELRAILVHRITNKRNNAERVGVDFDLTISDLYPLPETCPVLGIPINYGTGSRGAADNSMSIDRINPDLGYVKGNVVLVSQRANRIKNDATVDELRRIYEYYRDLTVR